MRVKDIAQRYNSSTSPRGSGEIECADTTASPLDDMILARATGMLATCDLLARDEVHLIGMVINNLDADPNYQPSETMMTAIQAINRKFASCRVRVLT